MRRCNNCLMLILLALSMSGCSHGPHWFSGHESHPSPAPVRTVVAEISQPEHALRQQWDKVFTALAGQQLSAQTQLLSDIGKKGVLPAAETDLQRALLLALGDIENNDMALAVSLASKYDSKQGLLSPQARFAMTIVMNKQADMERMDALRAKLDALKNIEESMMRRGQ